MATVKKTINQKHYAIIKAVGENDKCPPQAKVIVKTISEQEGQVIERSKLIELLKDGRLTTNQTPERIFSFYRPRLIEMGVMEERQVPVEVEIEVPDKPAKAEKPAATAAEGAEAPAAEAPAAPASVKGKKGEPKAAA